MEVGLVETCDKGWVDGSSRDCLGNFSTDWEGGHCQLYIWVISKVVPKGG